MVKNSKINSKEELISLIKKKRELSGISDKIVEKTLDSYIKSNNILLPLRRHNSKIILSEIRSELRRYSGRYITKISDREDLLKKERINDLLKTHSSTKERLKDYKKLNELIEKLKIKSILDLACGLNPIALASKGIIYNASDIKEDDIKLVKKFFKKNKIKGKVFIHDIRDTHISLPKSDICLLFKVLDIIESKGHKIAERIIKKINSKYLLISFPTKKLSGEKMIHQKRVWLEKMLTRLNLEFETIKTDNEIFYLVKKSPTLQKPELL